MMLTDLPAVFSCLDEPDTLALVLEGEDDPTAVLALVLCSRVTLEVQRPAKYYTSRIAAIRPAPATKVPVCPLDGDQVAARDEERPDIEGLE